MKQKEKKKITTVKDLEINPAIEVEEVFALVGYATLSIELSKSGSIRLNFVERPIETKPR